MSESNTVRLDAGTVDLDSVKAHIDILRYCKKKEAELKQMIEMSRAAIEEALGGNEIGTIDGHTAVRWKHIKTNRLNQKALKEEHPNIVAQYTEATEIRRFEVVD